MARKPRHTQVTELFPQGERVSFLNGTFTPVEMSRETQDTMSAIFLEQSSHFRDMLIQLGLPPTAIRVFESYTDDTIPLLTHNDAQYDDYPSLALIKRPTKEGEKWVHHALLDMEELQSRRDNLRSAVLTIVGRKTIDEYISFITKTTFAWMYGEILGKIVNNSCYSANRYGHYLPEVNVDHRTLNPGYYLLHQSAIDKGQVFTEAEERVEDERFRKGLGYMVVERELVGAFPANGGQDVNDILAELSAIYKGTANTTDVSRANFALGFPMSSDELREIIRAFKLNTLPAIGDIALRELADTIGPTPTKRKRKS